MTPGPVGPREVCLALMALCGLVLVARPRPRRALIIWLALLLAGVANAFVLNAQSYNLIHSNLTHYYLGAKYTFDYQALYQLMNAALDRPQINMRDLGEPGRLVRSTPIDQRAYFIDLLRAEAVEFDPAAPTPELEERARSSGAIRKEATRILRDQLPADQINGFRRDVLIATRAWQGRDLTLDWGFNGTPFYALVRHVDPTLYRPLGAATAWLNLAWQTAAVLLSAWFLGAALEVGREVRVAIAALVFASWDFVAFAFPGLVFAGFFLPIALAAFAMQRRAHVRAGAAIAWAGLIKLFPFVLLLPAFARLLRAGWRRLRKQPRDDSPGPWLQLVASCALAAAVLALAGTLSGRSWMAFFGKIVPQFAAANPAGNNVSASSALWALGIQGRVLPAIVSVAALAVLTAMFVRGNGKDAASALPRRSLVLCAALGWVAHNWLNYYSVMMLVLLPFLALRHRIGAAVATIGLGLMHLLPDFDDPRLTARPLLLALRVAPYVLTPAWFVFLELRRQTWSRRTRAIAITTAALLLLSIAGEAWRSRQVRRWGNDGYANIQRGDARRALGAYDRLLRLSPRDGAAHNGKAVACVLLGDVAGAAQSFERAIQLRPDDASIRHNYARFLLRAGRTDPGGEMLEAARRLNPHDDAVLLDLARVRLSQGKDAEAAALVARARELRPENQEAVDLWRALPRP